MRHPCYICGVGSLEIVYFSAAEAPATARSEKTTIIEDLPREKRDDILRIAEKHGARNVRVFGSAVRGETTETSDIDLLVDTAEQTSPIVSRWACRGA
jgi:hypothetical protein